MWKKKLLILSAFVILSACSAPTTTSVEVLTPPEIQPIITRDVEFKVVSEGGKAFYLITPQTYENLSYNVQEMLRYIREQKEVIRYYESVTQQK